MKINKVNAEAVIETGKKKKPFYLRWWFILLVIIVVGVIALSSSSGGEKIVWDDIILSEKLPEPPKNKGKIYDNSYDELWLEINKLSDKQYADYVEACKEKGFTVDSKADSSSYEAYNAEGYKLYVSHYGSSSYMKIELEKPMEMNTIIWPTSEAGKQLPIPKSNVGKFSYEHEDEFSVYIGNTSKSDYNEYVNSCKQKGFNVDYSKSDNNYYADNSKGWHVSIRYEGNNIMSIDIDAPSETESSSKSSVSVTTSSKNQEQPSSSSKENKSDNAISSDFKSAMDSYEDFMNDYIAFMKKYSANPTDIGLLADYADYMSDYADFVEDFEKWGDEDLNTAELNYYIEVQTRVNKKLLEVAE